MIVCDCGGIFHFRSSVSIRNDFTTRWYRGYHVNDYSLTIRTAIDNALAEATESKTSPPFDLKKCPILAVNMGLHPLYS